MDSVQLAASSTPPSPRNENTQDDDHQPVLPLGVELTGYRLFTTVVILGLGVPKAIYSYNGQALISSTLDWLAGILFALILFWLGVIEAKRPELSPRFFEADLAPPILKFLRRPEVYIWLLSALPLLLNSMDMRSMIVARRNHVHASDNPTYIVNDGLTLSVLAFSTATCIFCLQCVRVIWPRAFKGPRRRTLPFIINLAMWLPYYLFVVVKIFFRQERYPSSIANVAKHNILWMYPFTFLPFSKQLFDAREGYLVSMDLLTAGFLVFAEAWLIMSSGFSSFPGGIYGTFFSCCLAVFFSYRFFASIPTSWIPSFADIWGASKAGYARVRDTVNKVWAYVLGIGREV